MSKRKVEDIVEELAHPMLSDYKFELVDIEFKKEGPSWYLRLYIDKPGGISIDDCQLVSEQLSDLLDETDPIEQSYYLEVSSPGIDRPLKKPEDYEKFKNHKIEIKLYAPFKGNKKFVGTLIGLENNHIILDTENQGQYEIPLETASSVRLYVEF
ncbi:ribosome maturation factor RimP [Irregularibacter muris]|uniref:Ribosome maturation factor RimP n=1 Tax=Irregularibacter muris TaxID=1796619 RepID=A0AAE3L286_9FIRM|nr:ribosome maturation factor RimP [Irregularibacter muris]MCR1898109.1 ribosome maturation factor RimP [Irregularibacter muris]